MSRTLAVVLAVLLAAVGTAAAPSDDGPELRAGAASVDITPENGGTMLGYVRPDIATSGVHTRLRGNVLVLQSAGGPKIALVATDLGFALDKDSLVARVADLGYRHDTILYTGTHTHSGPESLEAWQLEQLAGAVRRADAALRPAVAGWGRAEVEDVGRNRSIEAHLANHGMDLFYGQGHADDDPQGVEHTVDRTLRLLRVEEPDGDPIAAWIDFPVHLTTVTPYNDLWDADVAGTTAAHLRAALGAPGMVTLYANGASGDIQPRFDSYNPHAVIDLHGRRIARGAAAAWHAAGAALGTAAVDVRWTRRCYCGQDVEEGRAVASEPVFGAPFFGGSEDGASIFHEPLATEGRRRPAALADPVHGRKIPMLASRPLGVHESTPEIQVIRIGDRLLLAAPGEPSVEMARRMVSAVRDVLPAGVNDPFLVGLSNDYLGYLVTPEEYDMQHYEGGHTVFGKWTSLLMRNAFAELTAAMAAGTPAPAADAPAEHGDTDGGSPTVGDGGVVGSLTEQPPATVERMDVVEITWQGAGGGVDRPLGTPFVVLDRHADGQWYPVDSDLGTRFVWRESDGAYRARYDVPAGLAVGRYRLRVTSGAYTLWTRTFSVVPSTGLRLLGATLLDGAGGPSVLLHAQHPAPDPERAIAWRPVSPAGGTVRLVHAGRTYVASWDPTARGWTARIPGIVEGDLLDVGVGGLVDGHGNTNGEDTTLTVGEVAAPRWPDDIGVGGGRAPGPFGEGAFPP